MIRFSTDYAQNFIPENELVSYIERHQTLLDRCKVGEERYQDTLGWLSVNEWANDAILDNIEAEAARIRSVADTFVIIGVGGSNNSARAVIRALAPSGLRIVYAGNTLSAWELNRVLDELDGHDVVIDCIAKNFETLEPGSSFRLLRQYLTKRYGKQEAAQRIVCTGTIGSTLEQLCRDEGYRFVPFANNVGGRYTALTEVHLLPLAVAGIDIRALVAGGRSMEQYCRNTVAQENSALRYAASRNILWDKNFRVELLTFFEPRLSGFGLWWKQLFAESEGVDGKGLFPATNECSEELHSLGQFVQDGTHLLFETYIDILEPGAGDSLMLGATDVADYFDYLDGRDFWDINKAAFTATRSAHAEVLPCFTLEVERLDVEHLGMLFYWFAFACYASSSLLGVNPFDQDGVEDYKRLMFQTLGRDA